MSTGSSTEVWALAGAVLVLALMGLRSWYLFRAQPSRTSAGLGFFHVVRYAAVIAAVLYIAYWFGR